MKKSYVLAGGVAFAALAVALVNTTSLTNFLPRPAAVGSYPQPAAPQPVAKEPESAASGAMLESVARSRDDAAGTPRRETGTDAGSSAAAERKAASKAQMPAPSIAPSPPPPPAPEAAVRASKPMPQNQVGNIALGGATQTPVQEMARSRIAPAYDIAMPQQEEGRDRFSTAKENAVKVAKDEPVSTFSIDVDTSSYSFLRSTLNSGGAVQKDSVRVEELVNYFPYDYQAPKDKSQPFKANVTVFPTPWNADTKLMHVGIKGYQLEQKEKPRSNLVFLLDTSGSMNAANKLPLVQSSMKLLLSSLKPDDTVAIVTYAGSAGVVLEPTKVREKATILSALDRLNAGGSTAGAEGIRQAYQLAEQNLDKEGVNRVILATDGDFNVGISDPDQLKEFIAKKRESGVFLSVLGFGRGNYNDALMQSLAQNGNGNAAYIDNLNEARKVLVEEAGPTLFPIAKDVKIQVEFNPSQVAEYRLIGYETRLLNREDFNNDNVDSGDIGAGHTVTALYEIIPVGSKAVQVDALRYQKAAAEPEPKNPSDEYAFVKIRYKLPQENTSKLITTPVDAKSEYKTGAEVPNEARFATAVAAFGQLLRREPYTQSFTFDDVIKMAESARGADPFGYRAEFINLVRLAKTTNSPQTENQ